MGQAKRTIIVRAFDDPANKGQLGFDMAGFGVKSGAEILCCKKSAKPPMKKSDHHEIVFELANESSFDLRFPAKAKDAIWVGKDDQVCPKGPTAHADIQPQSVFRGGECLKVHNHNSADERLKFSLVFEETTTGKPHLYDPIWVNKDAGSE